MRTGVAVVLVLLAAVGCAAGGAAGQIPDPVSLVLQPRDLPRGYEIGDDTVCGGVDASEGDWPTLKPLFAKESPAACIVQLQWVWKEKPPYARGVTSAAYVFDTVDGARSAYAARAELARFTASLEARTSSPLELGDEAELLHGRGLNFPAAGIVWRTANVVAVVVVEPGRDAAALTLARRQEGLIEHPERRTLPRPGSDPELRLDDPAVLFPVHWLGRRFAPGHGLPPLELELSSVGGSRGYRVELWYRVTGRVPGAVTLDTWAPRAWRQLRRTRLGRLVWDSPCARKTVVPLAGGHAEIFEGYGAPRSVEPPCPNRPPDKVVAHVYYRDGVVTVNMPYCFTCAAPPPRPSPYGTFKATERVVRALRLRARR